MTGAFRVSEKVGFAIALETNQPMQSKRISLNLNRIELDHQILRIALRIDASERFNTKA